MAPHILPDGSHLTQLETAAVLKRAGLSLLGPVAVNVAAPDEGNMFLLDAIGTAAQKEKFLAPLVAGRARSAFFMTEPAADNGAGSDPSMLQTTATRDGDTWVVNSRKAFITGALGASIGIVMARTGTPTAVKATMFLFDLPNLAVRIERVLDTIDGSMPGGHSVVQIDNLRVPADHVLGEVDEGFRYAVIAAFRPDNHHHKHCTTKRSSQSLRLGDCTVDLNVTAGSGRSPYRTSAFGERRHSAPGRIFESLAKSYRPNSSVHWH